MIADDDIRPVEGDAPPLPIRVVLADDHAVLREGVAALIGAQVDIRVVGQASSGPEAIAQCLEARPDVLVLDLTMPGGGLGVLERLRGSLPSLRVLVLTMHDDPTYLRAVLDAGALGYLVKGAAGADLVHGIRAVADGRSYVLLGDGIVEDAPAQLPNPAAGLSKREREVLVLVARGFSNRAIGERLGIRPKTVDTYRERFQEKLGLTGRAEIHAFAQRAGLLLGYDGDDGG